MRGALGRLFSVFLAVGIVCLGVFAAISVFRKQAAKPAGVRPPAWEADVGVLPVVPAVALPAVQPQRSSSGDESAPGPREDFAARPVPEQLAAFDAWVTRYLNARTPDERESMVAEGREYARMRYRALFSLIESDPEAAWAARVRWPVRTQLPAEVLQWLEKSVSGVGDYYAIGAYPPDEPDPDFENVRREAVIEGRRYRVSTYGARLRMGSRRGIGLHGIAVAGRLALLDSPVRILDPGEPIPEGRILEEVCGVSGKSTDVNSPDAADRVAVDTGDRVVYLCSGGHIAAFADSLSEGYEMAPAPGLSESPVDLRITTGIKTVLFIRVRFADQARDFEPQTAIGVYGTVAQANDFLAANAYGALKLDVAVTPVYTLPESARWYRENDTSGFSNNVLEAARAVAKNPQSVPGNDGLAAFDYRDYDYDVVRYTGGPGVFLGQAHISDRGMWMKTDSAGVFVHELGHNLGLWHANLWVPDDPLAVLGEGTNREYGDGFDSMSRNSGAHWHFNAYEKWKLGWLPPQTVHAVRGSGVYRIGAHDIVASPVATPSMALTVRHDDDRDYWLEFRQHEAWKPNRWISNGLGVRWDPWLKSNGGTQLIDTTPGSPDGIMDSALVIGRTFSDPVAGVHVTPLAKVGPNEQELDVAVVFDGAGVGANHAPAVTLAAAQFDVAVGEALSIGATASDQDGDPLAYFWEFGDRSIGDNAARVTKAWAQPGVYRARVVVSDRRGGTASASALITVGGGGGAAVVSGDVKDLSGQPVADAWIEAVSNDLYATMSMQGAWSDSDGGFALVTEGDEPITVVAKKSGWRFVPAGFLNPVEPGAAGRIGFVGVHVGHRISGVVRYASGLPAAGAVVRIGSKVEPADASGAFAFVDVDPGRHVLVAEKDGRMIATKEVGVSAGDVSGVQLREESYTVSGEIVGFESPASITVSNGVRSTVAMMQGAGEHARLVFSLPGVSRGRWNLSVYQAGASYSPVGFENPLDVGGDVSGLVFARDPATTYSISGTVRALGEGLEGVYVTAAGRTSTTDSRGNYVITGLSPGDYSVSVSAPGHSFSPVRKQVTINGQRVVRCDFESTRTNAPPVITAPPTASGAFDRGVVTLSVVANDDEGAENLRYSWSETSVSGGVVSFSHNHARAAATTTAFFSATGAHRLRVTVTDAHGAQAVSELWVQIPSRALEMSIVAPEERIVLGVAQPFGLEFVDQFGRKQIAASGVEWAVSGGGEIDEHGLFQPAVAGEGFVVSARYMDKVGERVFTVGYPDGAGSGITQEIWTGVAGGSVAALKQLAAFPDSPGFTSVIGGGFETAAGIDHNYGQRVRGYFLPPATGEYVFFIASDNESELWISPDTDPASSVLVASVRGSTSPRGWEEQAEQVSAPLSLTAGKAVYIEALHKEDAEEDHLAVGVMLPGGVYERPIPAHRLLPWGNAAFAPPEITVPAAAQPAVVSEALQTELSVTASSAGGESGLTYSWSVAGAAPGPVVFLPNGSNASARTIARFTRAGDYQLRVTVRDSAGQTAESTVDVRVLETIESWRRAHFFMGQLDDPAAERTIWGADADPDGDGVVNLLEYAYGLDPLVAGTEGTPEPIMVSVDGVDYLAITFMANPRATDVVITPQASSDLRTWAAGLIRMEDKPDGRVVYRDFVPAAAAEKRFLRVHVAGP